jgi:SagB-type dehydrogenase family enzyme
MLYYVSGIKDQDLYKNTQTRMLPSGGARYPIEIYIVVFKQGELEERLYHYNVKENSLDVLWRVSKEERDKLFSYEWASGAGMAIFITGVVHRATMKYGERGYRYMYYEAGAIAALLQVIACSVELNAVLMGGTNDENVEDLLGINAERESLFLAILSG